MTLVSDKAPRQRASPNDAEILTHKDAWEQTTLGSLCGERGKSIEPNKQPNQTFELYSVPSFPTGTPEIVLGKQIGSNKQSVTPRSVLLCKINPRINRVWIVGDFSGHPKIASTEWIIFPESAAIEPRFLCYFLQQNTVRDFLAANASGVGGSLMRVKASTLRNFPFSYPERAEQQRIVAEIEKQFTRLDAGETLLKRVQGSLKRYHASVLTAARESWPAVPLSKVCDVVSGYAFKSSDFVNGGAPVVKIANVSYGVYLDEFPSFLPHRFLSEFRRFQVHAGDILFALTRPITDNQVKACSYPTDLPNALLNQRVARLAPNEQLLRGYLLAYLRSESFKAAITAVMPQTLQPNLSPRDLAGMTIPLPPLAEQARIVSALERRISMAKSVQTIAASMIRRSARLRQSILHRAFEKTRC